jgi:hypothetical protein
MSSKRTQFLQLVYRYYVISQFPNLYPVETMNQAKEILSKYPDDFMSWKPNEQTKFLEENKLC